LAKNIWFTVTIPLGAPGDRGIAQDCIQYPITQEFRVYSSWGYGGQAWG
jgi:hypothetical protein